VDETSLPWPVLVPQLRDADEHAPP